MPGRLGDEVAARREAMFVARAAELDVFPTALAADPPVLAVLGVVGIGGVGKSALLRVWARGPVGPDAWSGSSTATTPIPVLRGSARRSGTSAMSRS